jgi:hypothetical protein
MTLECSQTMAHFWVHHNVSTLNGRANKIQQKKGPKNNHCTLNVIVTVPEKV